MLSPVRRRPIRTRNCPHDQLTSPLVSASSENSETITNSNSIQGSPSQPWPCSASCSRGSVSKSELHQHHVRGLNVSSCDSFASRPFHFKEKAKYNLELSSLCFQWPAAWAWHPRPHRLRLSPASSCSTSTAAFGTRKCTSSGEVGERPSPKPRMEIWR